MAEIKLLKVHKTYGQTTAVIHGMELEVADGEFVVLVGPSGCGKSTVLRMIAGLEAVTEGKITIGGKVVNDVPPQQRNLAMVFQNYALYPHKTVRENILFPLRKQNLSKEEMEGRLIRAAEALQMTPYLDRKPAALSGGQRQRVAMGRAIVRDADAFLFDEPLSNLDAALRHDMRVEIRRLHRTIGITSVYVTHDQVEAMTLADRVVVMRNGYIEQVDEPMGIYLNPSNIFTATFIGSPAMNILDAELQADKIVLNGMEIPLPEAMQEDVIRFLKGKEGKRLVKLGIRPNFLKDSKYTTQETGIADLGSWPVDVVEPLGFERQVHLKLGDQPVLARLDLRTRASEGDELGLSMETAFLHIFDPETEMNINRLKD